MSLQSQFFRGDNKLEAASVSDPAHILPGAAGEHVAKIQRALSQLDGASIDSGELQSSRYGSSTANAVLIYKKKRNIINRSYQTQADNIVGKMTIAALDREMLAKENQRIRSWCCGDPIRPTSQGGQFLSFGNVSQQATAPTFPANLDVLLQWTRVALTRGAGRQWRYFERASSLLKPFSIGFLSSISGVSGIFSGPLIPNDDVADPRFRDDIWRVRRAAEQARPGLPNTLRIIACPFVSTSQEFGITEGGTHDGQTFPDFILLNAALVRTDQGTLIHEMIHATGLKNHDGDDTSVFSSGSNRSVLRPEHAEGLSKAYFAQKKS